jgi:hypothetical protein
MINLLIILVVVSFSLLQIIEVFSFSSRVAGKYTENMALGYTLQQTFFTASRFLLILFLPSIAFLVESEISVSDYSLTASLSLLVSAVASFWLLIKLNSSQIFFQKVILNCQKNRVPKAIYLAFFQNNSDLINIHVKFNLKKINRRKFLTSFFAYFFLSSGFFFAFLLSNIFFEYRLTLSQITPLFHGIGAILVAFYLDPMLSRSIDDESDNILWLRNIYTVIFGRVVIYLFTSCLFMLIAVFF